MYGTRYSVQCTLMCTRAHTCNHRKYIYIFFWLSYFRLFFSSNFDARVYRVHSHWLLYALFIETNMMSMFWYAEPFFFFLFAVANEVNKWSLNEVNKCEEYERRIQWWRQSVKNRVFRTERDGVPDPPRVVMANERTNELHADICQWLEWYCITVFRIEHNIFPFQLWLNREMVLATNHAYCHIRNWFIHFHLLVYWNENKNKIVVHHTLWFFFFFFCSVRFVCLHIFAHHFCFNHSQSRAYFCFVCCVFHVLLFMFHHFAT